MKKGINSSSANGYPQNQTRFATRYSSADQTSGFIKDSILAKSPSYAIFVAKVFRLAEIEMTIKEGIPRKSLILARNLVVARDITVTTSSCAMLKPNIQVSFQQYKRHKRPIFHLLTIYLGCYLTLNESFKARLFNTLFFHY